MSRVRWLGWAAIAILLGGCATRPDYAAFFEHHPRSLLIVPAVNRTTAVDAPLVFASTVTAPFAERGYYVFPVVLTQEILTEVGASDEGLMAQMRPSQFREIFGADAVLFVTIKRWSTLYLFLVSSVEVEFDYRLVDTATGVTLWERTQVVAEGNGGGHPLVMAITAALNALMTDYRPLAHRANFLVVGQPGRGLPAGPYRSDFKADYGAYR